MDNKKQMSEHFESNVIKGKKFDFNDFKTADELIRYAQELEDYLKETDSDK